MCQEFGNRANRRRDDRHAGRKRFEQRNRQPFVERREHEGIRKTKEGLHVRLKAEQVHAFSERGLPDLLLQWLASMSFAENEDCEDWDWTREGPGRPQIRWCCAFCSARRPTLTTTNASAPRPRRRRRAAVASLVLRSIAMPLVIWLSRAAGTPAARSCSRIAGETATT